MEEYIPIIWMVVLVGFLVLSSVSKVRKKAEKALKRLDDHFPKEAWPTWDTAEAEADTQAPARREAAAEPVATAGEYYAPTAYEPEGLDVEAPERAGRHRPLQAAPASAMDAQRLTGARADEIPENGETDGIAEDFDLRKAVIYSEILKPKYDE